MSSEKVLAYLPATVPFYRQELAWSHQVVLYSFRNTSLFSLSISLWAALQSSQLSSAPLASKMCTSMRPLVRCQGLCMVTILLLSWKWEIESLIETISIKKATDRSVTGFSKSASTHWLQKSRSSLQSCPVLAPWWHTWPLCNMGLWFSMKLIKMMRLRKTISQINFHCTI